MENELILRNFINFNLSLIYTSSYIWQIWFNETWADL